MWMRCAVFLLVLGGAARAETGFRVERDPAGYRYVEDGRSVAVTATGCAPATGLLTDARQQAMSFVLRVLPGEERWSLAQRIDAEWRTRPGCVEVSLASPTWSTGERLSPVDLDHIAANLRAWWSAPGRWAPRGAEVRVAFAPPPEEVVRVHERVDAGPPASVPQPG